MYPKRRIRLLLLASLVLAASHGHAAPPKEDLYPEGPAHVRLAPIPKITLTPSPLSPAETAHIKDLIRQLANIDQRDFDCASVVYGASTALLPGTESADGGFRNHPGMRRSSAFADLIRLGPKALPFLLNAFDDKTQTRITVTQGGLQMQFVNMYMLGGRLANKAEEKILDSLPHEDIDAPYTGPHSHTFTIGDVCFVAIGRIVGRDYEAVRGVPSGIVCVNSPSDDPNIARVVRAIWGSANPAQRFLDSLLLDYSTRGIQEFGPEGGPLENWSVGSAPQNSAAMRMLYYFPRETAPLIANRLEGLRVNAVDGTEKVPNDQLSAMDKLEVANGVDAAKFVKAILWCHELRIQAALRSIFLRATDPAILSTVLPALDHSEDASPIHSHLVDVFRNTTDFSVMVRTIPLMDRPSDAALIRSRFLAVARQTSDPNTLLQTTLILKDAKDRPLIERRLKALLFGDHRQSNNENLSRDSLVTLRQFEGEQVRPYYRNYLASNDETRCASICWALEDTHGEWDREFLWPMLSDRRGGERSFPFRVCDAAALTISQHRKDIAFDPNAPIEDRESQIRTMRELPGATPTPTKP